VRRGQSLQNVGLILFARDRWVREDALRAAYLHQLQAIETRLRRCTSSDHPFDVAEAAAAAIIGVGRNGTLCRYRQGAQRAYDAEVGARAAALAANNGRADATREQLEGARNCVEAPESVVHTAVTNVIHVFMTGEPTSNEALGELAEVSGIANLAQPVSAQLLGALGAVSVASLRELVGTVRIEELQATLQLTRMLVDLTHGVFGSPSDLEMSIGALALLAICQTLGGLLNSEDLMSDIAYRAMLLSPTV